MKNIPIKELKNDVFEQPRYFIDIELDCEMRTPEYRRIEIPRRLAIYITELQNENTRLKKELEKCA